MGMLRRHWERIGFNNRAFQGYVFQFVALVLMVPLAAEPLFRLSELVWARVASRAWVVPIEPYLRVIALIAGFAGAAVVLMILVGRVRRDVLARLKPDKPVEARAVDEGLVVVVALLLAEGALSEIVIKLAEQIPLAGAWQVILPLMVFVVFSGLVLYLAAVTLRNVKSLARHRFENRIREREGQPDSWPARVVICALSVPAKGLLEKNELHDYSHYSCETVEDRFRLFADPRDAVDPMYQAQAESFVERFNWRQIALAYHEQMKAPHSPETLPQLILLCSGKSRDRIDDFKLFFEWLLEPLKLPEPDRFLEFICDYEDDKGKEKEIDFEDLDSIATVLRTVYDEQCKEHGAEKVIIDITGAQRPWTLAALEVTLDTKEHRVFSYVAQERSARGWVRYYDIDAKQEGARAPDTDALGMD